MVRKLFFAAILLFAFVAPVSAQEEGPFLRAQMLSEHYYPNSEILMVLRLYDPTGSVFGEIPMPVVSGPGAYDIRRLGAKPKTSVYEYGQHYYLLEYRYAIFVTAPGVYKIPPITFKGTVRGEQVSFSTEEFFFTVAPKPKEFSGKWRSAHKVDVKSGFNVKSYDTYVGETLRRAIVLKASGSNMAFFPEINVPKTEGMKIYKSPSKKKEDVSLYHLELEQRYNFIYIPQKAGEIKVPDFSFEWFDLQSNQIKVITVPGVTFNVSGDKAPVKKGLDGKEISFEFTLEHFYAIMAFVVAGLFAVALFRRYRKAAIHKHNREKLFHKFKIACAKGDAKKALEKVLQILKFLDITGVTNITEAADLFDDDGLREQAVLINGVIFGDSGRSWDGKGFYQAFMAALEGYARKKKNVDFPELYPFV